MTRNQPGDILGESVPNWSPPVRPDGAVLTGRYVVLEPLSADAHAPDLFAAYVGQDHVWDYMPYGPFADFDAYVAWVQEVSRQDDPFFYAIRNLETGRCEGVASYLRISPDAGSIEVGHINFGPALQKTRAATEAMYLMMAWAFEAGYRRYEWKCNARNRGSRQAAERLGLSYEGVFRQAAVIKAHNRDTAWFAAIDSEWPALRTAFEAWLSPGNFDGFVQKQSLSALTTPVRVASDPIL